MWWKVRVMRSSGKWHKHVSFLREVKRREIKNLCKITITTQCSYSYQLARMSYIHKELRFQVIEATKGS